MSTRAILACSNGDGRWQGVWNHWDGHTEYLGKVIIERVGILDGNLERFCRQYIDDCPGGWSDFAANKRGECLGVWSGSYTGGAVVFEKGEFPSLKLMKASAWPSQNAASTPTAMRRRRSFTPRMCPIRTGLAKPDLSSR